MLDGAISGSGNYTSGLQESHLNLTISVVGNVPMPPSNLSTYAQVVDYVVEINKKINEDSSVSKGRPLRYTLAPISVLREMRNKPDQSKTIRDLNEGEIAEHCFL